MLELLKNNKASIISDGSKWVVNVENVHTANENFYSAIEDAAFLLLSENMIEDGFGNSASAYCNKCFKKTMYIVRPGDFRCSECD